MIFHSISEISIEILSNLSINYMEQFSSNMTHDFFQNSTFLKQDKGSDLSEQFFIFFVVSIHSPPKNKWNSFVKVPNYLTRSEVLHQSYTHDLYLTLSHKPDHVLSVPGPGRPFPIYGLWLKKPRTWSNLDPNKKKRKQKTDLYSLILSNKKCRQSCVFPQCEGKKRRCVNNKENKAGKITRWIVQGFPGFSHSCGNYKAFLCTLTKYF